MRLSRDLLAGLLFMICGIGAALIAQGYTIGTVRHMGPGYFPIIVGLLLALIGAVLASRGLTAASRLEPAIRWDVRPLVLITAAVLAFALLIRPAGMIVALAVMLGIARFAGRNGSLREFLVMVPVLVVMAWAIFVLGLEIPLRMAPW